MYNNPTLTHINHYYYCLLILVTRLYMLSALRLRRIIIQNLPTNEIGPEEIQAIINEEPIENIHQINENEEPDRHAQEEIALVENHPWLAEVDWGENIESPIKKSKKTETQIKQPQTEKPKTTTKSSVSETATSNNNITNVSPFPIMSKNTTFCFKFKPVTPEKKQQLINQIENTIYRTIQQTIHKDWIVFFLPNFANIESTIKNANLKPYLKDYLVFYTKAANIEDAIKEIPE